MSLRCRLSSYERSKSEDGGVGEGFRTDVRATVWQIRRRRGILAIRCARGSTIFGGIKTSGVLAAQLAHHWTEDIQGVGVLAPNVVRDRPR